MSPLPVVAVSAPARVAEHLRNAPDGPVRLLHRTATALYVDVAGRCIGVVTPPAAQVPCALRIASSTPDVGVSMGVSLGGVLAAGPVTAYLEQGTLCLTGHPLRIGRFVDVRVPRITPSRVLGRAASPADAVARSPRPAAEGLAAHSASALAALPGLPARITPEVLDQLVGNGGGLTPLGDDVLCGWLAVLVATDSLTDQVVTDVRGTLGRTSQLSATLVHCALHGEVLPELAAYLGALGTPAEEAAALALTRIGHTSGAGLWWGARHALSILAGEAAA